MSQYRRQYLQSIGSDSVTHWSRPIYTLSGRRDSLKSLRRSLCLVILMALCVQLTPQLASIFSSGVTADFSNQESS